MQAHRRFGGKSRKKDLESLTFYGGREFGDDADPLGDVRLGADVGLDVRREDELLVLDGERLHRLRDPETVLDVECFSFYYLFYSIFSGVHLWS